MVEKNDKKPVANSLIVLREEFDDWAVLFDPDTGSAFGLNPVSVFVWKNLDGEHTIGDILEKLRGKCEDMPEDAEKYIRDFVNDLIEKGMAGYEYMEV